MVYEDMMKCIACGLHFIIYSDMEPKRDPKCVYCPECGQQSTMRLNHAEHDGMHVWQFVSM